MAAGKHAVVIGGGPVGLVAAIAMRRIGWSVTLLDAARPPIDKACGEGMMPRGRSVLRSLGIEIALDAAAIPHTAVSGVRFVSDAFQVEADLRGEPGIGIKRKDLHLLLVRSAANAGVTLLWEHPAQDLKANRILLRDRELSGDLIIGADGANSRVRHWAGLGARSSSQRLGFRQHFAVAPWARRVEVHWCALGQVYITPLPEEEICVAWMCRQADVTLQHMLALLPELGARLQGAVSTSARRGAVSKMMRLHRVTRGLSRLSVMHPVR